MHPQTAAAAHVPICIAADTRTYLMSSPNEATTPKLARDFVRALLTAAELGELSDTAALLTSEAVTNCHLHGRTSEEVLVRTVIATHGVRVSVHDDHPALPPARDRVPMRPPDDHESGRGLLLLDHLADRWGVTPPERAPLAKCIWFELYLLGTDPDSSMAESQTAGRA